MRLKVIVVDDSSIMRKKLTVLLEGLGHEIVASAGTGAEAIRLYGAHRPDLVTMDITMPGMDGIQATTAITTQYPEARIIMVTSHGQERMVIDSLDAGARGYVLKPVRQERLSDMIAKVMERSE